MTPEQIDPNVPDPDALDEKMDAAASRGEHRRMVEALLFASTKPLSIEDIAQRLPGDIEIKELLEELVDEFDGRGFMLAERAGYYQFLTAPDLSFLLQDERDQTRKLSRAAVETLAIIAYHQPVTRAEIEELRGVSLSRGTLDVLLEAQWVRPRGRKQVPGRPVLYATSAHFLAHFGLEAVGDLPGLAELKAAGLMEPIDDALERMLASAQADRDAAAQKAQSDAYGEDDRDADDDAAGDLTGEDDMI